MKNRMGLFIFLLTAFCACNKEQKTATCPVSYSIDSVHTYTLLRKWDFIGFVDSLSGTTVSPLCTDNIPFITFSDSSASTLSYPYNAYPYRFTGTVLLNYYDGSYKTSAGNVIQLSQTDDSKVVGANDVNMFEQRYHNYLVQVTRYNISHNLLTLFPSGSDTVLLFKSEL